MELSVLSLSTRARGVFTFKYVLEAADSSERSPFQGCRILECSAGGCRQWRCDGDGSSHRQAFLAARTEGRRGGGERSAPTTSRGAAPWPTEDVSHSACVPDGPVIGGVSVSSWSMVRLLAVDRRGEKVETANSRLLRL